MIRLIGTYKNPSGTLFCYVDSFLTQKIEVCVTAGARINYGGKVSGKIVSATAVIHRKSKGKLQRDLGSPDGFTVLSKVDGKS